MPGGFLSGLGRGLGNVAQAVPLFYQLREQEEERKSRQIREALMMQEEARNQQREARDTQNDEYARGRWFVENAPPGTAPGGDMAALLKRAGLSDAFLKPETFKPIESEAPTPGAPIDIEGLVSEMNPLPSTEVGTGRMTTVPTQTTAESLRLQKQIEDAQFRREKETRQARQGDRALDIRDRAQQAIERNNAQVAAYRAAQQRLVARGQDLNAQRAAAQLEVQIKKLEDDSAQWRVQAAQRNADPMRAAMGAEPVVIPQAFDAAGFAKAVIEGMRGGNSTPSPAAGALIGPPSTDELTTTLIGSFEKDLASAGGDVNALITKAERVKAPPAYLQFLRSKITTPVAPPAQPSLMPSRVVPRG